jgi:hypothetical protein
MHHDLPGLPAEMFSALAKPDSIAWLMISEAGFRAPPHLSERSSS